MNYVAKENLRSVFKIIFFSIVFGIIFNEFNPNKLSLNYKAVEKTLKPQFDSANFLALIDSLKINGQKEPIALETDYCYFLLNNELASFLDVRHPIEFEEERIEGANNIPFYEIEENSPALKWLIKDSVFIIYCDDEECGLSKKSAQLLLERGFKYVFYMKGGLKEWKRKNFPIKVKKIY